MSNTGRSYWYAIDILEMGRQNESIKLHFHMISHCTEISTMATPLAKASNVVWRAEDIGNMKGASVSGALSHKSLYYLCPALR